MTVTRVRPTPRAWSFVVLGALILLAGSRLGVPTATQVGALLVVLPVLALLSVLVSRPGIVVRREAAPAVLRHGATGRVRLSVRRSRAVLRRRHLAVEVLAPGLSTGGREVAGAPSTHRLVLTVPDRGVEERAGDYPIAGARRGLHRLGPLTILAEDPFGLTRGRVPVTGEGDEEVCVLPRVVPLPRLPAPARTAGTLRAASRHGQAGEADVTLRGYREGDELRRVHWPATARRGELVVRQDEPPAPRRTVLLLDDRPGWDEAAFEWAITLLASATARLGRHGHTFHLLSGRTFTEEETTAPRSAGQVLRRLATAEPGIPAVAAASRPRDLLSAAASLAPGHVLGVLGPGALATAGVPGPPRGAQAALAVFDAGDAAAARAAGWRARTVTHETAITTAWLEMTRRSAPAGARS